MAIKVSNQVIQNPALYYYAPASVGKGHYKIGSGVCPSICHVPQPNSRTERPRKPKIDSIEIHHTRNQWTYLEVKRSKVKVTRPINAHIVNLQHLLNEKAYELQNLYTDWARILGRKVVDIKCKKRTSFEFKRSKDKVTRPINVDIKRVSYLLNGKAYKLQTWYMDGARRPVSLTCTMTSKVIGQGHVVHQIVVGP